MDKAKLAALLARHPVKVLKNGNIRTCPVRLSFPHFSKPQKFKREDGSEDAKYGCALLFPLDADIGLINKAAGEIMAEAFGAGWQERVKAGKLHWPILDQGKQTRDDGSLLDGYTAGAKLIRVNSGERPNLVDGNLEAIEPKHFYPGCWVLATIRGYAWGTAKDAKKRGASFGLQNVQFLANDDRLGGGGVTAPEDDFEVLDASDGGESTFNGAAPASDYDFG
jgi:hypothetical protein